MSVSKYVAPGGITAEKVTPNGLFILTISRPFTVKDAKLLPVKYIDTKIGLYVVLV
jgi:hypothetical protein